MRNASKTSWACVPSKPQPGTAVTNSSARAVYYGNRNCIIAREVYDQINSGTRFPNLIQYISPIEWKNAALCGDTRSNPNKLWIRSA